MTRLLVELTGASGIRQTYSFLVELRSWWCELTQGWSHTFLVLHILSMCYYLGQPHFQALLQIIQLNSVQFSHSVMSDSLWPCESQHTRPPKSITISRSSLRLMSIDSVMPYSHLILCHPLFLLPPIPPSIRVFSNESTLRMRWPKYWNFSFSIIPSKEHPGLISFRMDWLELLAV